MPIKASLIDAIAQRSAVLFAGAGMSARSLGFAGRYVRDQIGSHIQRDYPDYDYSVRSFETVCDEYAALNDKQTLVNLLAGIIPQNALPQVSHEVAVKRFRFIVTTNWDLLFEAAYRKAGQSYQVLSSNSDAPNFNYDQRNLLKIHGTCDRPLTLVATTEDYEAYSDSHRDIERHVTDLVDNNTVVFVGYGFGDEHIRHILARVTRRRGQFARRSFAVGHYDAVRVKALEKRNIEVIDMDADAFFAELDTRIAN